MYERVSHTRESISCSSHTLLLSYAKEGTLYSKSTYEMYYGTDFENVFFGQPLSLISLLGPLSALTQGHTHTKTHTKTHKHHTHGSPPHMVHSHTLLSLSLSLSLSLARARARSLSLTHARTHTRTHAHKRFQASCTLRCPMLQRHAKKCTF